MEKLQDFADKNLRVVLFSGEGDSLHQIFDCIMQGPYSKVELWARGSERELPVPSWARDAGGLGLSRDMDLPCIGSKLKGDLEPPFTCGGDTRRSIIKSFVRDYINGGGEENNGNTHAEELIRERIKELREVWSDEGNYRCLCADGTRHSLGCCSMRPTKAADDPSICVGENFYENTNASGSSCSNNFVPDNLSLSFDEISGDDVIRKIISRIPGFLKGIFTDNSAKAFKRYNDPKVPESWVWEKTSMGELARSEGIYASYAPIVNYSSGEVGSPFRNERSIWYMCAGLVSQVMMTMPMSPISIAENGGGDDATTATWTASTVRKLESLRFDPSIGRKKLVREGEEESPSSASFFKSNLELYVEKLLSDSFSEASTFWHYAIRHVPSESLVCSGDYRSRVKRGVMRFATSGSNIGAAVGLSGRVPDFKMHGYSAFPLGGVNHECFCGWESSSSSSCSPPPEVCLAITNRSSSSCDYKISDQASWVDRALRVWGKGWPCPDMDISDSWGIATNTRAQVSKSLRRDSSCYSSCYQLTN